MNAIEFHDVTKKFSDFSLKNINFPVPAGFVTGIVGPNGSGKTTLIYLLMNTLRADQGDIKLFDKQHKDQHVKQRIGFVYDDLYMYEDFNIIKMKSFIAPLYKTWNEELFHMYLKKFALPKRKKIKHFSKGMRMKCSLLFALSHEPELIIMDEPTAGLDPIFRKELMHLLQELMVDERQSIFLSTHITADLDQIADFMIFIDNGEIVLQKSLADIQEEFHIIKGNANLIDDDIRTLFIGIDETDTGFSGLYDGDLSLFKEWNDDLLIEPATIEDVMYFMTVKEKLIYAPNDEK